MTPPNLDALLAIVSHVATVPTADDDGKCRHRSEYPEGMQKIGDALDLWDSMGYLIENPFFREVPK